MYQSDNAPPRRGPQSEPDHEAQALAEMLRRRIRGEVRFDPGSRALYATDASNYRQVPIGVVLPRNIDEVVETVECCRHFGVPLLSRGGGTSLAGQCCNAAVILDMSKYLNHIVAINAQEKWAWVEPGVVLDDLRNATEAYKLTFAPDPATHNRCTLGGMIGNNSCGVHSVMAGKTSDNIDELEILTYDGVRMRVGRTSEKELESIIGEGGRRGEIYAKLRSLRDRYAQQIRERFPKIPRRVSGYNLPDLLPENGFNLASALVGSESTCVVVLGAKTRLVYSPPVRSLLVLGYPDIYSAADHVPEILASSPIGLEGLDDGLVNDARAKNLHPDAIKLLPEGGGWLLVEFGGESKQESDDKARACMEELKKAPSPPKMKLFDDPLGERKIWEVRESGLGATAHVPGRKLTWPGWEDSAVPPEKVGSYLRELRKLFERYGYACDLYGHFGQGCIHVRIDFDLETHAGVEKFRAFLNDASDLVIRYGGSLSGEHGDGQARAAMLPKMFGEEIIEAFREFKTIWDPDWKMNPGKVVDPYSPTQNLRLGENYRPWSPETHFHFPADRGSFARASLRCVGVGKCRRHDGGIMCPSYMVTREEMHSTRGRARLLFEMLERQVITKGWREPSVREALDLCLACKGCKGECPVNVDMATYKAEFLSHYYKGRVRPMPAYSMGLIYWWARLASQMPRLANYLTQTPGVREVMKSLAGIAPERQMPRFAEQTFKSWFFSRPARNVGQPKVVLWADTFNNYFLPEAAQAAVEVLEAAGYQVIVPRQSLCCGRPLYDFGMLDLAKRLLRQILQALRSEIAQGVAVVGLEPSCVSVFRDEMPNLLPNDQDAMRLSEQSFLLGEFLARQGYTPPNKLRRKALIHGHCHHKSVLSMQDEIEVLKRLDLEFEVLDSGCCGMAGSFGFEKDHYAISLEIGERVLLPAVRQAAKDTLIVADGFSCREQIAQTSDRRALHLAQLLQMALRQGPQGPQGSYPERHLSGTSPEDSHL